MIRISRAKPKSARRSPKTIADAVQERLDATPERLARAREAGATAVRDGRGCAAFSTRSARCAPTACSPRTIRSSTISAG
jgi:hypothetical protein